MTDILAGGVALETGFASQIAEAERQVRSFLVTATRYLASGKESGRAQPPEGGGRGYAEHVGRRVRPDAPQGLEKSRKVRSGPFEAGFDEGAGVRAGPFRIWWSDSDIRHRWQQVRANVGIEDHAPWFRGATLDRAGGQAGDDVALREHEHHDRRQDGERDEGEHQLPVASCTRPGTP